MPQAAYGHPCKKPAHGAATTLGQTPENPVAADAGIVADCQLGAVGEVDAGLFPAKIMQQHVKGQQQPRHQPHKPAVAGQL